MEQAVEQIVTVMRVRYDERLYVPDLAAEAFFSPFHFSRIFRRETGVAPGQYLTAIRLFEAKRLLLTTSLSVADIACRVGYQGVGTFTTRFTKLVSVPPSHYRRLPPGGMLSISEEVGGLPDPDLIAARRPYQQRRNGGAAIIVASVEHGAISKISRLFVGVFDQGIPQGPPIAWKVVPGEESGHVRLDGVPAGLKLVIAVAEEHSAAGDDRARARSSIFVCVCRVQANLGTIARAELRPRRPKRTDPPIMIPLGIDLPALQTVAT
jgi:AraC-like DNA-binding protein